ncbi:MAG: hypothetical protein P8099_18510 [Gemmatimonadota bacterium]
MTMLARLLPILALTVATGAARTTDAHAQTPCGGPHRQFDFWLGDWNVRNHNLLPNRTPQNFDGSATDRVYAVVDGCAVVENWQGEAFGRFIRGFSVRAYDPAAHTWTVALLWPMQGSLRWGEFHGGFSAGRGDFLSRRVNVNGDTTIVRLSFLNIGTDSLQWQNGTSTDGGRTWTSSWRMDFHKRDPVRDGPLFNGPTRDTARCPEPENRRFDFLLGDWEGDAQSGPHRQSEPGIAYVQVIPILGGCASMDVVRIHDGFGDEKLFRVRAYEPDRGRWVVYRIDGYRRVLVRMESQPDDPWTFRGRLASGDSVVLLRTEWEPLPDGGARWMDGESTDGGKHYTLVRAVTLRTRRP